MAQASVRAFRTLKESPGLTFTDFFAQNGAKAQIYPIDVTRETVLTGILGTKLSIQPFSFCDYYGNVITGNEVNLHLKEVFYKPEMVLSNKVTTSRDRLLESGGQIFLAAFQGKQPLKLKTPVEVGLPLKQPLSNPLGMHLFEGSLTITRAFRGTTAFDWRLLESESISMRKEKGKKYFYFSIDQLNWYNCDTFYARKAPRTMVSASINMPIEKFDDLAAFILFKGANAVARMYPNGHRFTSFNIPQKKPASILILGLKNSQLFYGCTTMEQTTNRMVEVEIQAGELQELKALLNRL